VNLAVNGSGEYVEISILNKSLYPTHEGCVYSETMLVLRVGDRKNRMTGNVAMVMVNIVENSGRLTKSLRVEMCCDVLSDHGAASFIGSAPQSSFLQRVPAPDYAFARIQLSARF
jgi:hypothetical protein